MISSSDLSQKMFAIDMLADIKSSLNHSHNHVLRLWIAVNLLNIVDLKLLFSPTTSLFLNNRDEVSNMLSQQCWPI